MASDLALALHKALSERLQAGDVVVVNELKLSAPKTRELAGVLKTLHFDRSVLVVAPSLDPTLMLAARNLPGVEVTTSDGLHTYQVLRSHKLLFTREAIEKLGQRLQK